MNSCAASVHTDYGGQVGFLFPDTGTSKGFELDRHAQLHIIAWSKCESPVDNDIAAHPQPNVNTRPNVMNSNNDINKIESFVDSDIIHNLRQISWSQPHTLSNSKGLPVQDRKLCQNIITTLPISCSVHHLESIVYPAPSHTPSDDEARLFTTH
ncbi:uncharacterized protein RAG0_04209 [Rhynchosporium agropyri]|uniref:Uncharacterized protein n=1 Tax=Rhynchosporium agropyri TaxID=914238 RepID=A0A1E1K7U6_9HELO|nr:uncharacterized protein RAG0_04209 [Rhynchosporium agropyri]